MEGAKKQSKRTVSVGLKALTKGFQAHASGLAPVLKVLPILWVPYHVFQSLLHEGQFERGQGGSQRWVFADEILRGNGLPDEFFDH